MYKFSFIVPVYNTEKYIAKCIESLVKQEYENYEVIVVDDGSTDRSNSIANRYAKKDKRVKIYKKKNGGLSDARNLGITKAEGDYFVFVDSDDYISSNLLSELVKILNEHGSIDLIKYKPIKVNGNQEEELEDDTINEKLSGKDVFVKLLSSKIPFEMAWLYAYNANFWRKNNFIFPFGKYHEDFALIPIVLLKTKKCFLLDQYHYYYLMSDNSIMRNADTERTKKKAYDYLEHFDNLLNAINGMVKVIDLRTQKFFKSYIANAVLLKAMELNDKDLGLYILEMKKRKIASYLSLDSFGRVIKKILVSLNYKLYINLVLKRK